MVTCAGGGNVFGATEGRTEEGSEGLGRRINVVVSFDVTKDGEKFTLTAALTLLDDAAQHHIRIIKAVYRLFARLFTQKKS